MTPDTIAFLAAFFTMIGYLPQAIKTIKTRETKAISFWMYFFTLIGVILWLIFGLMIDNVPIILKNVVVIILSCIILGIKTVHIFRDNEDIKSFQITRSESLKKIRKLLKKSTS